MKRVGARGYGLDLRERSVLAVREGMAVEEAAQEYRVHLQTVQRYLNQGDQGLLGVYVKPSGRPCTLQAEREQQLLQQLDEHADATLVARERSETLRTAFLNDLAPYLQQPERLMFLNESGFNTRVTRGYARAPSTERATCPVVRAYGKNHTLICAQSLAGPLAPLVIEGEVNGDLFEWYVQNQLCPTLSPGQVVVMDNLFSHHRASIRTFTEAQKCTLLYLSYGFRKIPLF